MRRLTRGSDVTQGGPGPPSRRSPDLETALPPPVRDGRPLWLVVAVFVVLYGVAQSASDFFSTPDGVSVWFPPAALTFAFLSLVPPRVGAPVAVATRIGWSMVLTSSPAPTWLILANAVLVVLAYLAAAQALRRRQQAVAGPTPASHDVGRFIVYAAGLGPLLAALTTRAVVAASGRLSWSEAPAVVASFWVGDALAVITLAPLFWAVWLLVRQPPGPRVAVELVVGPAVTAATAWVVVGSQIGDATPLYLILVPVVAMATRHGLLGAALSSAAGALGATGALAVRADVALGVLGAHVFLIVMAAVGLTVGVGEVSRRRARSELEASEQRYRRMVQVVEDYAIYLLDPDGRIVTWNDGARRLKGFEADEVIGRRLDVLHTPEQRAAGLADRLLDEARRTGYAYDEGWRRRKDGSRFWAQVTLSRLDDDGVVQGFTKVTRDLTARRRAQEQLEERTRQLERSNQELDRFASVASHDLQEPLRMVTSYTELLDRRYGDQLGDDAKELIGFAVDGARRMRDLINDLLEYSRIATRAEGYTTVALGAIIEHATRDLRLSIEETDATVDVGPMPVLRGDPTQLRLLFQNLMGNAIKYRSDEPPRLGIDAEPAGPDGWLISVRDNGIGIPVGQRELSFEPFRRLHARSRYPGTGIGLAICRRIVERHGGRIWIESGDPSGSVFRFTLRTDPSFGEETDDERRARGGSGPRPADRGQPR